MFRLFSFDLLKHESSREDLFLFKGNAIGIFFVSIFCKGEIYGNIGEYATYDLDEMSWWQKFIYKKKIAEYRAYRKGDLNIDADGWSGIRPVSIQFPIRFIVKVSKMFDLREKCEHLTISYTYGRSEQETTIIQTNHSIHKFVGRK